VQRFIVRQNIQRFERQLKDAPDEATRRRLEGQIAEGRAELGYLDRIWTWTCPHLNIPDHLGAAAETLLDQVFKAHRANFGSLQVWDDSTSTLRLLGHRNFDRASAERFASVADGAGSVCEAARVTARRVLVEDVETADAFTALREWTRTLGIRAIQTTPVFNPEGAFVGAFSTHFAAPHVFTPRENGASALCAQKLGVLLSGLAAA
jgi:hypothetical protein